MSSTRRDILTKADEPLLRQKEKEAQIKNSWRWEWLEKTVEGMQLCSFFHKILMPGKAYCSWCQKEIDYSKRGLPALTCHAKHKKHQKHLETSKTNYSLSSESSTSKIYVYKFCMYNMVFCICKLLHVYTPDAKCCCFIIHECDLCKILTMLVISLCFNCYSFTRLFSIALYPTILQGAIHMHF